MTELLINAVGLQKNYNLNGNIIEVLKGVNFVLPPGKTASIIGHSGAGKSTLLHVLGLLESPSSGELVFMNKLSSNLTDAERSLIRLDSIGFVFQFHHLLPEFNAEENVMLPALILGKNKSDSKHDAEELLIRVGLKDRMQHKPGELSGGEQQRVALARSMINKPNVILADEPTGNLDQEASRAMHKLLWELSSESNTSLLVVTHNIEFARQADLQFSMTDGVLQTI